MEQGHSFPFLPLFPSYLLRRIGPLPLPLEVGSLIHLGSWVVL